MTAEAAKARDAQLVAAFAVILTHPAGFGIELFADLWIDPIEDGRFRVGRMRLGQLVTEEIFEDVSDAVRFYLDLRDTLKLGLDYETEPTRPVPKFSAPTE
jgi:hypothetical protein